MKILTLLIALMLTGCPAIPIDPAKSNTKAASGLGGISAGAETIIGMSRRGEASPEPYKSTFASIGVIAGNIKRDVMSVEAANMATYQAASTNLDLYKQSQAKVDDMQSWWIGARSWRWIRFIIGAWIGLGVASVILGAYVPGWGIIASKFIVRLLPFANLFSLARDKLIK